MPLTVLAANQAKPKPNAYKLFDGGGLFLLINRTGSKHWKLAYRFQGVEKKLSLGTYPRMGLAEARAAREAAKRQIEAGIDPSAAKRAARQLFKQPKPETSFEKIAREWHAWYTNGKKLDETYARRIIRFLEADIFPATVTTGDGKMEVFGQMDIAAIEPIEPAMLLAVIRKIEERGALDLPRRQLRTCRQCQSVGACNRPAPFSQSAHFVLTYCEIGASAVLTMSENEIRQRPRIHHGAGQSKHPVNIQHRPSGAGERLPITLL